MSVGQAVIYLKCHQVMIPFAIQCCQVFKVYFIGALSTTAQMQSEEMQSFSHGKSVDELVPLKAGGNITQELHQQPSHTFERK